MDLLLVIGVFAGVMLIIRLINKAGGALDRATSPHAASREDDLLRTVVTFRANAQLSDIREAVSKNVTLVKWDILHGAMKVIHDSSKGIEWEGGSVSLRNGFKARLVYGNENGKTTGEFSITEQVTAGGVSPYIDRMTQLRNAVIAAFKAADPNAEITTSSQSVRKKQSWF